MVTRSEIVDPAVYNSSTGHVSLTFSGMSRNETVGMVRITEKVMGVNSGTDPIPENQARVEVLVIHFHCF
jgi:hypothetical protein